MGLFSILKSFIGQKSTSSKSIVTNEKCLRLLAIDEKMNEFLTEEKYIAKSDYLDYIASEKECIKTFEVLESSEVLESFCHENNMDIDQVRNTVEKYHHFEQLVEEHNEDYVAKMMVKEKVYLDQILKDVDPNILLDEDQRKVVLTDEDHCLVIAGAGAGKTTTVAAKVKYLVEKDHVDPKQILVISFTNKAVQELRDKINDELKISCPIATFHSTGNAILRKQSPEKLNIVEQSKLYFVLQDYFKKSIMTNESLVNNLILFFGSYFDAPYEGKDLNGFFNHIAKGNYSTMRSDLDEFKREIVDVRTKKKVTIQNEFLRSYQEVEIANFLYLNNIDYEYEPLYKYDIKFARKPYTPDFIISQGDKVAYIEHFGITQDGRSSRYSPEELEMYKQAINDKVILHRNHGTTLIYTFSSYNDQRPLLEHLKEELEKHGFELKPRSNKEIIEKLVLSEESRYIRKLVFLVCRFIHNFKTNGYGVDEFTRMYHSTTNERSRLFLNICNDCYLEYERYLKKNNAVDFEDMINESARVLREVKEMKQKLDFKYIIVDEYQDISRQRFDLVTALSDVTDAKIIAVGDDWQSIYAFSGSDITLFTKFEEKMGYAKLLKIVNTYRNSQEVIDIAGNFIQRNTEQIRKSLKSPKNIVDPVIIYTYDGRRKKPNQDNKSGANYAMAMAVQTAIEKIMEYNRVEEKPGNSSILLLGRFGFDGDLLERSGVFEYVRSTNKIKSVKYPFLNITFMTAHSSKGLGYDNVIIVNGRNEIYGFPSKIEDDPVLSFVVKHDHAIDYAEERRLFYVAMTRTKNRVFMVAPEENPSEFLLEIKKDYKNVKLCGQWNEDAECHNPLRKTCPICGYPLQLRYKPAYGLRLYICTNEPEVCGFMTNEIKAGKLSIQKCDQCRDGYLVVKPTKKGDYFLACTNYKKDGTGCDKVVWKEQFYKENHYELEEPREEEKKEPVKEVKQKEKKIVPKPRVTTSPIQAEPIREVEQDLKSSDEKKIIYKDHDLHKVTYEIICTLEDISKKNYYGVTILTDVLKGKETARVLSRNLNELSEFGVLSNMTRKDIMFTIDWLIGEGFILQTKHPKYPVLHPTYVGRHFSEEMTERRLKKLLRELKNEHPQELFQEQPLE